MVNQHRLNREGGFAVKRQHIFTATGSGARSLVSAMIALIFAPMFGFWTPGINRIGRRNWLQRRDSDMCFALSDRQRVRDDVGKYARFHFSAKSGHLSAPTRPKPGLKPRLKPRPPPFRRCLIASNAAPFIPSSR
jgi:hypothetical protein